jgi:hypothetical protein
MAADSPIKEQDLLDGLAAAAEAFAVQRIAYAVIGGMATGIRAQPRYTKDLDFLLQVPQLQLPPLLDDLTARGFTCDAPKAIREWTQEHMTTLSFRGLRVDWLKPVIPLYQHVLDRATEETWLGHRVRVASAEGLMLLKLLAWRTQDQLDVENLVAAHGDALDMDWMWAEWATVADPADPRLARLRELVVARRKANGEPGA